MSLLKSSQILIVPSVAAEAISPSFRQYEIATISSVWSSDGEWSARSETRDKIYLILNDERDEAKNLTFNIDNNRMIEFQLNRIRQKMN